jgi:hypothetical protein
MTRLQLIQVIAVLCFWTAGLPVAHAVKVVKVNFNSTGTVTESNGKEHMATATGFDRDQVANILAKAQRIYDNALGAGAVMFMEGTGGDVDMVVSGGTSPDKPKYGNAGKPGQPGVVYKGEFDSEGLGGNDLINALGETLAHELAHKFGVNHNWDDPPSIMTAGGKVPVEVRIACLRAFTSADIDILRETRLIAATEHSDTLLQNGLQVHIGSQVMPAAHRGEDPYLSSSANFTGPSGSAFGYMSSGGQFIFQGDRQRPSFLTFLYNSSVDLAVRLHDGSVHTLSGGSGRIGLGNPNPNNPNVFSVAQVQFDTNGDGNPDAFLILNATVESTTGGFGATPIPVLTGPGLIVLPLLILGMGVWVLRKQKASAKAAWMV